jgi:hypothetical protein
MTAYKLRISCFIAIEKCSRTYDGYVELYSHSSFISYFHLRRLLKSTYLFMFRNYTSSNMTTFFLYFLFMIPVFVYIPIRIYMTINYSGPLLELPPPNLNVCPREAYTTGYRTVHVYDSALHLEILHAF